MGEVPRHTPELKLNPKQLNELFVQMAGDTKFHALFDNLYSYREAAIADLCNDAVVGDTNKILATIGEIRTYTSILSIAGEIRGRAPAQESTD
jgi:hypothetical protein